MSYRENRKRGALEQFRGAMTSFWSDDYRADVGFCAGFNADIVVVVVCGFGEMGVLGWWKGGEGEGG